MLVCCPYTKQYNLDREVLDYRTLVVRNKGSKPFKSFDAWMMEHDFKEVVRVFWEHSKGNNNRLNAMKDKLKGLKNVLKIWNKDKFYKDKNREQELLTESLDLRDEDEDFTLEMRMKISVGVESEEDGIIE